MIDPVDNHHKLGKKIDNAAAQAFVDKILQGSANIGGEL